MKKKVGTGLLDILGPWLIPAFVIGLVGWSINGLEWLAILPLGLAFVCLLDIYWGEEERKTKKALKKYSDH